MTSSNIHQKIKHQAICVSENISIWFNFIIYLINFYNKTSFKQNP